MPIFTPPAPPPPPPSFKPWTDPQVNFDVDINPEQDFFALFPSLPAGFSTYVLLFGAQTQIQNIETFGTPPIPNLDIVFTNQFAVQIRTFGPPMIAYDRGGSAAVWSAIILTDPSSVSFQGLLRGGGSGWVLSGYRLFLRPNGYMAF